MELDITFQDRTVNRSVYVKMDVSKPLLLSEGICRQLEIVTYHPEVEVSKPKPTACSVQVSVVRVHLQNYKKYFSRRASGEP